MTDKKSQVLIIDALTGEQTYRDLTPEELEANQIFIQDQQATKASEELKIQARKSALSKLAALGLTEEEIAAL